MARHEGQVVFVRHTLPGERVVARVTEGRVGRQLRARRRRRGARGGSRPRPRPVPVCRPRASAAGATSSTRPSRRSARSRRQSCGAVRADRRPRGRGGRAARAGRRGRSAVAHPRRVRRRRAGRAGLRRHRSRDIVPVDDCLIATRAVIDSGVLDTEWPTSSRSTSSTPPTRTSRCSSRCPHPMVRAPAVGSSASSPGRRLGGRVRRGCPWLLAGPPGRGLDLPFPGHGPARGAPR